ncbi:hypothetical protein BCU32_024370 [Vibrio lentus]|uniref:hypothetical protein n=1 Tax=Vibrio lentus TaxID=136468 RepID=UPI0039A72ACC
MEISNKKDLLAMSKMLNVFLAVGFFTASFACVVLATALTTSHSKRAERWFRRRSHKRFRCPMVTWMSRI